MFKLYTDAATMNKSGDSSGGILIIHDKNQRQIKTKLNAKNNHSAEFEACLIGFKKIKEIAKQSETIIYYTDSKIVYESLEKRYAKHYQPQLDKILLLQDSFSLVINNWISDKKNEGAHNLAQQALHSFY
ncbi:ribonuclease HI family protein [Apilactobacillus micheneri]|uniref:ribonuclease HI family protein n=1 Tax=Apilactobacillus micheneri TaxID=1899430 RepID=UPI00112B6364|nr:ribonuclease HI family protein [Apilactobacillus micheneri]TPR40255.1 ribonuclease HI [Apilactobacillus micheneri]